jgi:oligopeptide transport system substrate-binding protein
MRLAGIVIVLTLLATLFSGASFGADSTAPFRFRLTADPSTLDWNLARTSHETYVIMNAMEGLVEVGRDLKPQPALSERWEVSSDGLTYTFYIRPGVKWSDGRPLKASDFEDSWLRLLNPKTHSSYASFLFDLENAEAFHAGRVKDPASVGVRAIGESKLQIKLRHTVPYFIFLPSFWVTFPIRSDLIRKYGKDWATPGKLATLGPYLIKDWKRGRSIELERNPGYHGEPPAVAAVEAVIEPSDAKARALFESGKLDILLDARTDDLVRFRAQAETGQVRVAQFPYLATYYLGFNVEAGPLKDRSVRRALALAVDREAIPAVLQGGQSAATGWIPPGIEGHRDGPTRLDGTLYDARGLLTRAGFPEGARFPKLTFWIEKFDGAEAVGDFIGRSLHDKLGIEVERHVGSSSEFQKALAAGKESFFLGHWGADFPDPANFLEVFRTGSGTNYTRWSDTGFDGRLSAAGNTLDPAARLAAFAEAEDILVSRESVIVPLFYKRNTALVGPRLRDFEISPLNYLFLKAVRLR